MVKRGGSYRRSRLQTSNKGLRRLVQFALFLERIYYALQDVCQEKHVGYRM